MSNIQGQIKLNSNLSQSASLGFGLPFFTQQNLGFALPTVPGTAGSADNADLKYAASLTLSASPTVLDLTALTDPFGNSINFARVRSILIVNTSTVDGHTVKLGYSTTTSNAWTSLISNPGQLTIGPNTSANSGVFFMSSPNTTGWVVGSPNKLLNLDPGANTITTQIEIVGCSA